MFAIKVFFISAILSLSLYGEYSYEIIKQEEKTFLKYNQFKYELDFNIRFCNSLGDGCYGTGVFFNKISNLKEPLMLIKSLSGAHSSLLRIFNPNKKINKEVKCYAAGYFLDYEKDELGYSIMFAESCNSIDTPVHKIEFYSPFYQITNAIYFQENLQLSNNMLKRVKKLVKYYKEYATTKIKLIGYTSSIGDSDKNMMLGFQRANKIKKYFISHGIDKENIIVTSRGEEEQVCTSLIFKCLKQNDRVEFILDESLLFPPRYLMAEDY